MTNDIELVDLTPIPEAVSIATSQLRVCRVVTVPISFVGLLSEQLRYLRDQGIRLILVSSPGPELDTLASSLQIPYHPIFITRQPNPKYDMLALYELIRYFRSERFDIVHSVTPKAGLLTALAGKIARIPIRLHTYTGQVWVESQGVSRAVIREFDRLVAILNTRCYADSHSQRQFLIDEGLVNPTKISVIGAGSIAGVDLTRFNPDRFLPDAREQMRHSLGISQTSFVILFVGRITKDKGIAELVEVFSMLLASEIDTDLIFVGPFEPERDPLPEDTIKKIEDCPKIHVVGFSHEPERFMALANVLCLPSYREGFGGVAIEAAAMGLPVVGTSIVGLRDAVEDGVTGVLVLPKNPEDLYDALSGLIANPEKQQLLGQRGRERVEKLFDAKIINAAQVSEYHRLASCYLAPR